MSTPNTIESSLVKQREALKTVIQECSHKEKERLKRLASIKRKSDQEQLLKRYNRERQVDQERIENLTKDYFNLQEKLKEGVLDELQQQRQNSGRRKEVHQELLPNRFVGLEDHNGQIFYADIIKKFDNHDHRFEAKRNYQPFDLKQETKRLKLLTEKRDLLNRLINIQNQENQAKNTIAPFSISSSSYARQYDQRSVYSDSQSNISYATFADPNRPTVGVPRRNGPPPVPRLQLPGIK